MDRLARRRHRSARRHPRLARGWGNAPPPPTAKVNGTVKMNGKPMPAGEVRFAIPGQPAKSMDIKDGAFTGEAFVGDNHVDVVWDKDGPAHPMDPSQKIKVNVVADMYSGPGTTLRAKVTESGAARITFEVQSKR